MGVTKVLRVWMANGGEADAYAKDACGQECVTTAVSRFLHQGTLELPEEDA